MLGYSKVADKLARRNGRGRADNEEMERFRRLPPKLRKCAHQCGEVLVGRIAADIEDDF